MWALFICNFFTPSDNLLFLIYKQGMKNSLIITFIFMISFSAMGSSYCFDYGVFAVQRYKEEVSNCSSPFNEKLFDELKNSLMKNNSKRILRASSKLRLSLDNATWSSGYTTSEQKCIKDVIRERQKTVDAEVLRSMELCL